MSWSDWSDKALVLTVTEASLLALLKADRSRRRYREQTGSVVKRSDGFYIRYYRDSEGGRTKVTETRVQELSRLLLENRRTQAERNRIESEIPAAQLALTYYREALKLEKHVGQN